MTRVPGFRGFVVLLVITAALLAYTFISGNRPFLGLDLQGGVSVVLLPKGEVDDERIEQAIEIMRQRIDSLGVAEPEITRQGSSILIQIPGVAEQDRAIELVGQTAELQFRPVLGAIPAGTEIPPTETPPGTDVPGAEVPGTSVPTEGTGDPATDPGVVQPGAGDSTPAEQPTTTVAGGEGEQGLGGPVGEGEQAFGAQEAPTTPPSTTGDLPPTDPGATPSLVPETPLDLGSLSQDDLGATPGATAGGETAIVPPFVAVDPETGQENPSYQVGPVLLTGAALESASVTVDQTGQWIVNPVFKPGAEGIDQFNAAAAVCNAQGPTCPTGQLAIVLDGQWISAPVIQAPQFSRDQIQISGNFTDQTANDLATALRYGALPVELEQQSVEIVSATIGEDALVAGLLAGAVGFVLVTLYMLAFYRLLGLLAMAKLVVELALLWAVVSWLGSTQGLALTLAGVTGIIVSIGVSIDSNVVYYEHLREDIRRGRSMRSATDRSFQGAFSTILKADGASLLGALLLYWLAVGAVRGFAFYLALSTILDMIGAYWFMRPSVAMAVRTKLARRKPAALGLPPEAVAGDGGDGSGRGTVAPAPAGLAAEGSA